MGRDYEKETRTLLHNAQTKLNITQGELDRIKNKTDFVYSMFLVISAVLLGLGLTINKVGQVFFAYVNISQDWGILQITWCVFWFLMLVTIRKEQVK